MDPIDNNIDPERPLETRDAAAEAEERSLGTRFDDDDREPMVLSEFIPESLSETNRRSGLAWSAGIVFFGSVVFMLVLGWFADLLLGSSPWGMVGGIVLGSLIGFVQFFRLTSRIFAGKVPGTPKQGFLSDDEDN